MSFGVESAAEEEARVNRYLSATPEEQEEMRKEAVQKAQDIIDEAKRIAQVIDCERFVKTSLIGNQEAS